MEIRFATLVLASTRALVPISVLVSGLVLAPRSALSQEHPSSTATTAATPYLEPVPVRILPARSAGGCLDAAQVKAATDRLGQAAAASGAFVPSAQATNLLRMHMDLSDGICQVTVEFQGDDLRLEGRRLLAPGETVANSKRLEQAVEELAGNWFKAKAATLTVTSEPAGAAVRLDGVQAGKTPEVVEHLRPGTVALRVGLAGYGDVSDTVFLQAGSALRRDCALRRLAGVRDNTAPFARSRPGQSLQDLFERLIPPNLPEGRQTVAIFPFQVQGSSGTVGYDPGVMAAEYGVVRFSRDPRFAVVERAELNRLLQEQALGQSGALDDSGAVKAGKLLAARYIVTGTVRVQGATQEFSARMVSVETGEVVSAAVASSASQNLEALYREALGERGQVAGAVYRSAVGPGWGQFYTGHPVQGSIVLGATIAALGWSGWTWMDYDGKHQTLTKFRNGDPSTVTPNETVDQWVAAAEHARSQNNRALSTFEFSLGILGAVWAANLVDAGILGYEDSRRIRAEYFTWAPAVVPTGDGVRLSWRF